MTESELLDIPTDLPAEPLASVPETEPTRSGGASQATERGPVHFIPLPIQTSQMLKKLSVSHPGLLSGAYAPMLLFANKQFHYSTDASLQHKIWVKTAYTLNRVPEVRQEWQHQSQQRSAVLTALQARQFVLMTSAPLYVESSQIYGGSGLDLHPLYGFPYLPAARLKGLMRQYAEQQWLPAQPDATTARAQLHQLLGEAARKGGDSGSLVIHDAWPEQWPKVSTDLQACHHRPYYQRREAAGDWQKPEPHYFLSLNAGASFRFALSVSRPDQVALLELAESWLKNVLSTSGYGSGTANGYGLMHAPGEAPVRPEAAFVTRLQLNTPAFYQGADSRAEHCQLRPSSLRGLLRWWWRTLHSGFLPQRSLQLLENALWGNRGKKGAVRLRLQPQQAQPLPYPESDILRQLPAPEQDKTKPGLSYLTYGLSALREQPVFMPASSCWELTLSCEPASLTSGKEARVVLSAEQVLAQVKAALWLLCHFGGSGQRMRKGWGSFAVPDNLTSSLEDLIQTADQVREHCGFSVRFQDEQCESPALAQRIEGADLLTPWKNEWFALHQLGYAYQSFFQAHKHQAEKQAFGLPRTIGDPIQGQFKPGGPVKERHASPLFLHFDRQPETGLLILRMVAFPSPFLPDLAGSQQKLTALMRHIQARMLALIEAHPLEPAEIKLKVETRRRARAVVPQGKPVRRSAENVSPEEPPRKRERRPAFARSEGTENTPIRRPRPPRPEGTERKERRERSPAFSPARPVVSRPVQAGDKIEAVLLAERTKKGGWRAEYPKSQLQGPIVNPGLVPSEKAAGDTLTLIIHSVNRFEMAFRVPTEADFAEKKPRKKGGH